MNQTITRSLSSAAAHAASVSHQRGQAGFSVGRTMFGVEGNILTEAPSLDEAINLAGLNFEVEKVPAFHRVERSGLEPVGRTGLAVPAAPEFLPAQGAHLVRRKDNFQALGIVGDRYRTVQNRDVLRSLDPLLQDGLAKPEAGGVFDEGATSWMLFRFDVEEINRQANGLTEGLLTTVQPFGIVLLRHDGNGSNLIQQLPYRIACLNALPGVIRGGKSAGATIRHTGEASERTIEEAQAIFGSIATMYGDYAALEQAMRFQRMTTAAFQRIMLDAALPLTPVKAGESKRAVTNREKQVERRSAATNRWWNGLGHRGDGSTWEALNGVIEAMDHDEALVRGRNLKSDVVGSRARIKARLMSNATRYAQDADYRVQADKHYLSLN